MSTQNHREKSKMESFATMFNAWKQLTTAAKFSIWDVFGLP